jgi:hypothetical protein
MEELSNRDDTLVVSGFLLDTASYGQSVITSTNGGDAWFLGRDSLRGVENHIIYANGYLHEVHQIYVPGYASEIHYMRSSDLGITWHDKKVISTLDSYNSVIPMIAADPQGNIYVGWRDSKYGCYTPWSCARILRMSSDNGSTWSDEELITETHWAYTARMVVNRQRVFVVWGNDDTPPKVESRTYSTSILNPCPIEYITPVIDPASHGAGEPEPAIGTTQVAVAWVQYDSVGSTAEYHVWARVGKLPFAEMRIDYPSGWNLVSLPVAASKVYSLPNMVAYEGGYVHKDTMHRGRGYWAKGDTSMLYEGTYVGAETVDVRQRWNIIGSITEPIPVSEIETIPPGIIQSPFFEFTGLTYAVATTLNPGRAYWVKVSQDGEIILRKNGIR